jgi:hypothetical protein
MTTTVVSDLVRGSVDGDAGLMSEPEAEILHRIQSLVDEEHRLREGEGVDRDRLRSVEEQLDQCWDLLRQRRARREFDQDPGEATARSTDTVENYLQ